MQRISRVLGLAETQPAEFAADPHIQQTSSGAVTVHLQQQYKSIPIFQATQAVRFGPNGAVRDTAGSTVTVAHDVPVSPTLSVEAAVLKAAEYVAVPQPDEQAAIDQFGQPYNLPSVDITGFVPKVIAKFNNKPEASAVLEGGPFGDRITVGLLWFSLGDDLRLGWEVILTMPAQAGQYFTIVDANTGEILYCHQLMHTVAAQGNVYWIDGGGTPQLTPFPRPLGDYGLPACPPPLPANFPDPWVAVDRTVGNCTNAHQGGSGPSYQGTIQANKLIFNPTNAVDQNVLNAFYFCCYMHDYFYLLGFREADGNFQTDNFGRGGQRGDPIDVCVYPGAVWGVANMSRSIDGSGPTMQLGTVVDPAGVVRHTALDATVVFHEFTHGVTDRLVGGPLNNHTLDDPQSSGMNEGLSDYFACVINNTMVVAAWVTGVTNGFRRYPYDNRFPDNFGQLGTGRYAADPKSGQPIDEHNVGEIWCATLMEMTRNTNTTLAAQLVVDALKLSPANPGFLDMRDCILKALLDMQTAGRIGVDDYRSTWFGIWRAFSRYGMGPSASSNGASLSGIVADFNDPWAAQAAVPALSVLLLEPEPSTVPSSSVLLLS